MIKTYQIEDMNKGFDGVLVHGIDILFNPVPQNKIKFQKPSLLAPIQQSIFTRITKRNSITYTFIYSKSIKKLRRPVNRNPLLLFAREIYIKVLWTRRVPAEESRRKINSISIKDQREINIRNPFLLIGARNIRIPESRM